MKTVIAKKWPEISKLGKATFTGVPVMVPDDFPAKKGQAVNIDPKKVPMAGVAGDVIQKMDREIAKQWIIDFIENHRDAASITSDEIYGILLTLGVSKTDFARLLKVHKGSVTKYVDGSLAPTPPVAQLMVIYLAAELTREGAVKAILEEEMTLIQGLTLTVPSPKFSIKRVV
jgi:DNA-binding transcriptional regulator YiaG